MMISVIALGAFTLALFVIAWNKGEGQHLAGVRTGLGMIGPALPLLIFSFLMLGLLQALVPREQLVEWIGPHSGWRGILIGALAGGVSPGGPVIQTLIASALWKSGAGIGMIVAYLTGGAVWGLTRLPIELGILGWRLTLMRLACTFFVPPLAGWLAHLLFTGNR